MLRSVASGVVSLMSLGAALLAANSAAGAGDVLGAAPAARGPQVMLYISQSLGSRGSALPLFGLRIEKLRTSAATSQPLAAMVPVQRSELIDLQIRGYSDVRLEFGRRLVWDISRGALGPHAGATGMTIGTPINGVKLAEEVGQQSRKPEYSAMTALVESLIRRRQGGAGGPANVDSLAPARSPPTDDWVAKVQLRSSP